jgi:hypothetical protein
VIELRCAFGVSPPSRLWAACVGAVAFNEQSAKVERRPTSTSQDGNAALLLSIPVYLCALLTSERRVGFANGRSDGAVMLSLALLVCLVRSREGGFNSIMHALRFNKSIIFLKLIGNMTVFSALSLRGSRILMRSLELNTYLLHMDLSGKSMGNEAAPLIAKMLGVNNTLLSLDLSGNMLMSEVGARSRAVCRWACADSVAVLDARCCRWRRVFPSWPRRC